MHRLTITVAAVLLAFLFALTCIDTPQNPFAPENARVSLLLKSSNYQESDTAVTDTVGKTVRLGLCLYLTEHIDSTVISVSSSITIDTTIVCRKKDKPIDTAYFDLVFATPGTRSISAIAHVGKELRQATAKIYVVARPTPNRKPELAVKGSGMVTAGQACTLKVSATDPDSGQTVMMDTLKCPSGSSFNDTMFIWQTTIADTGVDTIVFIARDNGSPVLSDTEIVQITVNPLPVNHPPKWDMDTVNLTGTVGWPVSLTLTDTCSDPDNDTLSFALLPGAPDNDTVLNNAYSFSPLPAHEGTFYPLVVAHDSQKLADTLVIKLTINPADTTPPTVHRISPQEDSATISASSCQVRVWATDKSGIRSVSCFKAADSIPVSRSDTVYTATITGIIQNQYTKVSFIAIDSSRNANACTLSVFIKRDSTMLDAEGPVIIQKTGPIGGSVITDPIIVISDSIIDPSGIDSVYWMLNSVRAGTMSLVSGSTSNYTLRDTLSKYRSNRIVIYATDRSTRRNRDSAVVELDYNISPTIDDTAVATDRNTAKTWILSAQSQDNDSLSWSRISSPSSISGTVTGILPSITFTPAANWSGTDSFYIRVTDGYWSDTAKILISVANLKHQLMATVAFGNGTIQVPGSTFDLGTVIQISAIPDSGYVFKCWAGDVPGEQQNRASITLTMDGDKRLAATFVKVIETVTLNIGESNVHGSVYVNGYYFLSTRTIPAKVLKINTNDLADYQETAFPTGYNEADQIVFSNSTGKLYTSFTNMTKVIIAEIDPVTLSFNESKIIDTTHHTSDGVGHTLLTDGPFIYVTAFQSGGITVICKYSLTTFSGTPVAVTQIDGSYRYGHAMNLMDSTLYVTGAQSPPWVARLRTSDLTVTQITPLRGGYGSTDDFAMSNRYLFIGTESINDPFAGILYRIDIQNFNNSYEILTGVTSGPCYAVANTLQYIWAAYATSPGTLVRIDPASLEMKKYRLDYGMPNEIISDGKRIFVTYWGQDPGRIQAFDLSYLNGREIQ